MRFLVLAALVASAGVGCSFDRPLGFRAINTCTEDSDCATARCYEGVCAATPEVPLRVSLQVLTGPADLERAPASSILPTFEVHDNARLDLQVSDVARVAGTVRFRGEPVPATLTFTRPAAPGAPTPRVEVETGDPFGDGAVDYVASLAAGEEYALEVRVAGALFVSTAAAPELDDGALASRQLPPLLFEALRFAPGTHTFDVDFDPALFEPCDATRRSGCELTGTLSSVDLEDAIEPVSGVDIRAVDPQSGRTISSTATVADGRFSLRVAPFEGDYDLQVVPGPSGSPYRATTFPAAMLTAAPELLIRRYPVVSYVALVLDAETQEPVQLATVTFQSEGAPDPISGAASVYRTSTLSGEGDDAGRIEVQLQPGRFTVVITPVETQNLAIHVEEVLIPDEEDVGEVIGQAFELERRAALPVHLQSFTGEALDLVDVHVSPVPADPAQFPRSAAFARTSSTTTDADGAAQLPVDVGRFEVFARPDASRGFPHAFAGEVVIESTAKARSEELVVPAPTVLAGSVHTADGAPLGGATIRVTLEVMSEDESGMRFLRMGEATSEPDGSYRLLLPSRL